MCWKVKYFKTGTYVLSYWPSINIFTRYSSDMETPFWTPEMSQIFISSINQNIHLFYSSKHSNYFAALNHICSRNNPVAAVLSTKK